VKVGDVVGDVITGIGYQFADGQKIVKLERVILTGKSFVRNDKQTSMRRSTEKLAS